MTATSQVTERDVLSMRGDSFAELLEQYKSGIESSASLQRLGIIAQLLVGSAVGLVRSGTQRQLAEAGTALARYLASPLAEQARVHVSGPQADVAGLMAVLSNATSADSRGGHLMVLRDELARKIFDHVSKAPVLPMPLTDLRAEFADELGFDVKLHALELANLLEILPIVSGVPPGVYLGSRGLEQLA